MEFHSIFITKPARISVKHQQLIIEQEHSASVPLEDISCVLIETQQAVITSAALRMLAEYGVSVFLCDEKHLPCGTLLPMNCHSRQLKLLKKQIDLSKPLKKQLWQSIVQKKIQNQAKCLRLNGLDEAEELSAMARRVASGDPDNLEAQAAAKYFPLLFGDGFTRDEDCLTNAALNYGYAILRGLIARNLVTHGFEPCLGIHHHSELNQFNLADDLIEPFRPMVDLLVSQMKLSPDGVLTPQIKQQLFSVPHFVVSLDKKRYKALSAVRQSVISLSQSLNSGKNQLLLPNLLPTELYQYA